jgi:hypothetical protein
MKIEWLGQAIMQFKLSDTLIDYVNKKMDNQIDEKKEISAVPYLSGKIKKEYDVLNFFNEQESFNEIFENIKIYAKNFTVDFDFNLKKIILHSAWINDQKEGEYQIVHKHSGNLLIGLSCIIFLKVPDFGEEYTHEKNPMNGRTTLISNSGGLFNKSNITLDPKVGDMYIFPYDIQHVVYPFRGNGLRRSMSLNIDLHYSKN